MTEHIGSIVAGLGVDDRDFQKGIQKAEQDLKGYAKETDQQLDKAERRWKSAGSTVQKVVGGLGLAAGAYAAVQFGESIANVGVELDSLQRSYKSIFGTQEAVREEMEFIDKTADRLGLSLSKLEKGYKNISAAAKGTAVEGKAIREVFTGVSEAGAVLGMTADETGGALNALSQIISKGKVQAEELRGQLGERLPGAFQIAARAMDSTTQELSKMLEDGEVLADDFIPKFARQLRKEFGDSAEDAGDRAGAAFQRFQNALLDVQRELATGGFLDEMVKITEEFTKWIEANDKLIQQDLPETMRLIGKSIGFVAEMSLGAVDAINRMVKELAEGIYGPVDAMERLSKEMAALKSEIRTEEEHFTNEERLARLKAEYKLKKKLYEQLEKEEKLKKALAKAEGTLAKSIEDQVTAASQYNEVAKKSNDTIKDTEEVMKKEESVLKKLTEQYQAKIAAMKMTTDQYEIYQAVQRLGEDATEKEIAGLKDLIKKYQELADAQDNANRIAQRSLELTADQRYFFKGGYEAPEGIGKSYDHSEQMDKLDERMEQTGEKAEETAGIMEKAFDGWANSYSRTLNEMLWESESTFDGISESFGKMVTAGIMEKAFDGWANSYSRTLNEMLWESESTFDGISESFGKMVTAGTMEKAFDGWANSYSRTLNEMLWESEVTFDGILESFGKMVTEMMIQAEKTKLTENLFEGGSTGNGWVGTAVGVVDSALGGFGGSSWTDASYGSIPGIMAHKGGIVGQDSFSTAKMPASTFADAPHLHDGLKSDEYPAILQRGEEVVPKNEAGKVPDVQVNVINQTGEDASARQKQARWDGRNYVIDVVMEAMDRDVKGFNGMMKKAVRQ